MTSIALRFVTAYEREDRAALSELYDRDACYYSPLAWPAAGRSAVLDHLAEWHRGFPGLKVDLHDEFTGGNGTRAVFRIVQHWRHTGRFLGRQPTGRFGSVNETHVLTLRDGLITDHVVSANTFSLAALILQEWNAPTPLDTSDPLPARDGTHDGGPSVAGRLVDAIGRGDHKALRGLYDPEIAFYSPVAWGVRGVQPLVDFIDQFHAGFPGLEMTLHDEVVSADGRRVALRFSMAFSNTGSFFGNPPTGRSGVHIETHVLRLRDGRIVEQVVGDTNFGLPRLMLTDWRMPLPEDTPDPAPV